jgi:hypothetical protein
VNVNVKPLVEPIFASPNVDAQTVSQFCRPKLCLV